MDYPNISSYINSVKVKHMNQGCKWFHVLYFYKFCNKIHYATLINIRKNLLSNLNYAVEKNRKVLCENEI